jgi:hypothetical protein
MEAGGPISKIFSKKKNLNKIKICTFFFLFLVLPFQKKILSIWPSHIYKAGSAIGFGNKKFN